MRKEGRDSQSPSIGKVLHLHDFRHLWIGQFCSQLGANMLLSILALRIYEITKSNTAVSGLYVAYGVPAVVFGMIAGVAVDHLDKRKVLAFCNVSRSLLIIPLFFFPGTLWLVYTVMFINSLVSQFYLPAEAPLIPRLVPPQFVLAANSLFSFTFFTSIALGFILAGPALKYTGEFGSFALLLVLYLTAVWSVTKIPEQNEQVAGFFRIVRSRGLSIFRRILRDLTEGLKFSFHSRPVADALILLTGTQIVLALLGVLGPGFADSVLRIDVTDASVVILGPAVLGIILGALWVGNYGSKYDRGKLTSTGILGAGIFLILIALLVRLQLASTVFFAAHGLGIIILSLILFFFLGISNSFLDVPSNATLQQEAVGDMRGRIYGILTAAAGGVGIVPVLGGGMLADSLGVGKVLLMLGVGIVVYGVVRKRFIV